MRLTLISLRNLVCSTLQSHEDKARGREEKGAVRDGREEGEPKARIAVDADAVRRHHHAMPREQDCAQGVGVVAAATKRKGGVCVRVCAGVGVFACAGSRDDVDVS